jgi:hypothetical protein
MELGYRGIVGGILDAMELPQDEIAATVASSLPPTFDGPTAWKPRHYVSSDASSTTSWLGA